MERVLLLIFLISGCLLDLYGLEITEDDSGGVFVSQQKANRVLQRQRRYNHGLEEILHKDNLERECREEDCSMEEAREVFEDDEKTMEFWAGYIDGDQCQPNPCQNAVHCVDGINSYVCWCKPFFSGKNCETDLRKQCSVNNGGCSHFCVMQEDQVLCRCADGYRLGADRRSCQPTVQFSCGSLNMSSSSNSRSIFSPRSSNSSHSSDTDFDSPLPDDYDELLEYFDHFMNYSDKFDTPETSAVDPDSGKLDLNQTLNITLSQRTARSVSEPPEEEKKDFSWAFPQLPTIVAQENSDQRIVGGFTAKPGEIPWQVTLMSPSAGGRPLPFCGGSLLSDSWVITAAHCLVQVNIAKKTYFVRVGEHDVSVDEGPERDHDVAETHIHHLYNFQKSQYNHDIALLKLATPVELSPQRRPICLGPKDFTETLLRESSTSLVSGWGRLKFLGPESNTLQMLQVPYVERTLCKLSSRDHITTFMFCAGYKDKQMDACQGDSGGPHASLYKDTWFLTGIVSWGEECAKDGKYGVYTRVSKYYRWISQTTGLKTKS